MHWHITVTVNLFFKELSWSLASVLPSFQTSSEQAGKCITGLKLTNSKTQQSKVSLISTRIHNVFPNQLHNPNFDCVCVCVWNTHYLPAKYQLPLKKHHWISFCHHIDPRLWNETYFNLPYSLQLLSPTISNFDSIIPSAKNHLSIYNSNSFIFILTCTRMTVNML